MNTKSFNHDFIYESYKNTISRKTQYNRHASIKDVDNQEQQSFRNIKMYSNIYSKINSFIQTNILPEYT